MGKRAAAFIWIAMIQMATMAAMAASCGYCPPRVRVPAPPQVSFPPSPAAATCPIGALKLGACADVLGGLVHLVVGDPAVNQCCSVLSGLLELEAALCLCWDIQLKLLDLNVALPIAQELLLSCGKNPPQGFTCPDF